MIYFGSYRCLHVVSIIFLSFYGMTCYKYGLLAEDENQDGILSPAEFLAAMNLPSVKNFLHSMDVNIRDIGPLFEILDDGNLGKKMHKLMPGMEKVTCLVALPCGQTIFGALVGFKMIQKQTLCGPLNSPKFWSLDLKQWFDHAQVCKNVGHVRICQHVSTTFCAEKLIASWGDGMITVSEFCKGLQQLKGAARAIDMVPQLGRLVWWYFLSSVHGCSGCWFHAISIYSCFFLVKFHHFQLADRSVPIMSFSCTLILCVALEQLLTFLTNTNHEQKTWNKQLQQVSL